MDILEELVVRNYVLTRGLCLLYRVLTTILLMLWALFFADSLYVNSYLVAINLLYGTIFLYLFRLGIRLFRLFRLTRGRQDTGLV